MMAFKILVLLLAAVTGSLAQSDFQQAGLDSHNSYRSRHQQTGPMTLDNDLNQRAQDCAKYYALEVKNIDHSCKTKNGAGENLMWGSGSAAVASVKSAVDMWYKEIKDYNYNRPGFSGKTGHFTQVVWKNSVKLGIGTYYDPAKSRTYVVGLYSPPGNYQGQFEANVLRTK